MIVACVSDPFETLSLHSKGSGTRDMIIREVRVVRCELRVVSCELVLLVQRKLRKEDLFFRSVLW